jgi:hemolysin D
VRRSATDTATAADKRAVALAQELVKLERRSELMQLASPVAGTVQQLAVHTVGGVVSEAQPLMAIVPAESSVEVDVAVENKDIGFVRAGQAAEVKLETFPFTRYGTVPATVKFVSQDAVMDETKGAMFQARLRLHTPAIDVDGKTVQLAPGMAVTAEIKTGERRIIEVLTEPFRRVAGEALRER